MSEDETTNQAASAEAAISAPAAEIGADKPTASVAPLITPTVGRRVHFHANAEHQEALGVFDGQQPCDAGVLYVWGDRCVNLEVTGPSGSKLYAQNVRLLQEDDLPADGESHAAWMPYQAKTAAASA